jgi:predicted metal-binding transcription factor (methanogenesis marker protein 9)
MRDGALISGADMQANHVLVLCVVPVPPCPGMIGFAEAGMCWFRMIKMTKHLAHHDSTPHPVTFGEVDKIL